MPLGAGAGRDARDRSARSAARLRPVERAGRSPRPQPASRTGSPDRPAAGAGLAPGVGACPLRLGITRASVTRARLVEATDGLSTGVGSWSENSAARARPSAAVAIRARPVRLATKQARSAARRTDSARLAVGREGGHPDRCADHRATVGPARIEADGADRVADPVGHEQRPGCRRCPAAGRRTRRRHSGRPGRESRPALTSDSAIALRRRSPAWWPRALLTVRKSSRSSMIRLNGSSSRTRPGEDLLERAVVEQAGEGVVSGPGSRRCL